MRCDAEFPAYSGCSSLATALAHGRQNGGQVFTDYAEAARQQAGA